MYLISYDLPAYYDISLQKSICFQSALKHIGVKRMSAQGRVMVSGVICPFLYATFRLKRVNNEKIWLLFTHGTVRTDPYIGKNPPIYMGRYHWIPWPILERNTLSTKQQSRCPISHTFSLDNMGQDVAKLLKRWRAEM